MRRCFFETVKGYVLCVCMCDYLRAFCDCRVRYNIFSEGSIRRGDFMADFMGFLSVQHSKYFLSAAGGQQEDNDVFCTLVIIF